MSVYYDVVDTEKFEKVLKACELDYVPKFFANIYCGKCGIVYAFSNDLKYWELFLRGYDVNNGYKIFICHDAKVNPGRFKFIINSEQFAKIGNFETDDVKKMREAVIQACGNIYLMDHREINEFGDHDINNKKLIVLPLSIHIKYEYELNPDYYEMAKYIEPFAHYKHDKYISKSLGYHFM